MRGFEPLRLFRSAVHAVIILRRIERILAAPRAVPVVTLRTTPYSLRPLRKMLDAQVPRDAPPPPHARPLPRPRSGSSSPPFAAPAEPRCCSIAPLQHCRIAQF